ncbi:MAG: hypothetical protein M1840_004825 [Geoglossum simile]|nr:MAG: hypothetical protein M1840_004825 [Geoglossum simile]
MDSAGTLRGCQLARAQRAPAGLESDPQRLEHEQQRFSHSPPPCASSPLGTTVRFASPDPRNPGRKWWQRGASHPRGQFAAQEREESKRIWDADLDGTRRIPVGSDPDTIATQNVKKRWVDQGIWNAKWDQFAFGRWKHEEPLELESEIQTDTEAEPPARYPMLFSKPQPPKPRRPKSDDEKRRIAERRVARNREREASRPYHQFVYQISEERKLIQGESASGEDANADINTRAYENVKNTWAKRGIWDRRWGILPGMSWEHEVSPLRSSGFKVRDASHGMVPLRDIFGHIVTDPTKSHIFVRDYHSQTMNSPQQGPSTDIHSAGLESGDAECSPFVSNPPHPEASKSSLHPTAGRALRLRTKPPSQRDRQLQLAARESLGKAHGKKRSRPRRRQRRRRPSDTLEEVSSSIPLSPSADTAEPLPSSLSDGRALHRSKWIESPVFSIANSPANTSPVGSLNPPLWNTPSPTISHRMKRTVRPNLERKAASSLTASRFAKPGGVLKRRSAKTAMVEGKQKLTIKKT